MPATAKRSSPFSIAARRPHKNVFEEDTLVTAGKQSVALRASNLAAVPTTWGIDSDNLVLCSAARTAEQGRL